MKKRNLIPFNENALKQTIQGIAISAMLTANCCSTINRAYKDEVIAYKYPVTIETTEQTTSDIDYMENCIILQRPNGTISLLINQEHLSLKAAAKKYPELTAKVCEYIADKTDIFSIMRYKQTEQPTEKIFLER